MDVLEERRPAVIEPAPGTRAKTLKVCLINPRFEPSFWGWDFIIPLFPGRKRYWSAPGSLPLLAALAPAGVSVELLDENVRSIDWDELQRFDVIGVTGMIVQRTRMIEILTKLRTLDATIVVGGPYVTVAEATFDGLCDVRFIGEAEQTWPVFLQALASGSAIQYRYEQSEKTDMSTVPAARFDLLDVERYGMTTIQFSRGCPFQCEFCDIITIFGRRPRTKTPEQFVADVDAAYRAGASVIFLVDDNFIGNKVAAKNMLPHLIEWQRAHGFPLQFGTEASVNLADDPELIELMVRANFRQVFIGLESPRSESLNETRKFQNTRGDSMLDKVRRVRDGGLVIQAGFIVGFDNDDARIFDEQYEFIQASGIGQAMVSILTPIPTTPLYDRLNAEGRLSDADDQVAFVPAQMTQTQLREGHAALMRRAYEAAPYFDRILRGLVESPAFRRRRATHDDAIRLTSARKRVRGWLAGTIVAYRLMRDLVRRKKFLEMVPQYTRAYGQQRRALGRDALPFQAFAVLCLQQWHFYNIARYKKQNTVGIARLGEASAGTAVS